MESIELVEETKKNDESIKNILSEYKDVTPKIAEIPIDVQAAIADEQKEAIEYKVTDPITGRKKKVISGNIISGAMIMIFINNIVPMAICMVHNKYAKGYEPMIPDDVRLDKGKSKELEVFMDAAAQNIELKGDPTTMAILAMISLYGMQYWGNLTKKKRIKKPEKDEKNIKETRKQT